MALPAVFGSGFYELKGAIEQGGDTGTFTIAETLMATGIAFVIGYAVIAWLLKFVSTKSFATFIIYRIALGSLLLVLLATGVIS